MPIEWLDPVQANKERQASAFLIGELMILCLAVAAIATCALLVLAVWLGLGA